MALALIKNTSQIRGYLYTDNKVFLSYVSSTAVINSN
jgi:hypothetical protein